jgi:hypothetical protein
MPSNGLSLVGFMTDRDQAVQHLRTQCVPAVDTDADLETEWHNAQALRGAAVADAGNPHFGSLPTSHAGYVAALAALPWFAIHPALGAGGVTFEWVEIDKLLAFQFVVDQDRSTHHCAALTSPPTTDELFNLCLPHALPQETWSEVVTPNSLLIRSRNTGVYTKARGLFPAGADTAAGIIFGHSVALVHVVRLNGRSYLHNGFHRVYGARMAGATHIPCVFRNVPNAESVGIVPPHTFDLTLLEGADPPTLEHFASGRALPVQLRAVSRILHVSWAEYVIPIE